MNDLITRPLMAGLGLTVLHALWQFTLVALLAAAGLALIRGHSARARHAFAYACLLGMGLAFLATASLILPGAFQAGVALPTVAPAPLPVEAGLARQVPGMQALLPFTPWLALGWMLGASLMSLRLGGAMLRVDRVLRRGAFAAPPDMQAQLDALAHRLKLRRRIQLLLREHSPSPLAFGWLRPVILLPLAALAQLPPEALEAVLAHELAHIARGDYLANLLQSLLESILFFHPAVWWLSRQVRELREHACDDLAVRLTGDPLPLAEGLQRLERLRRASNPVPQPALAAAKGPLMSRITRLLLPSAAPLPSWRLPLALLAVTSVLGAAGLSARPMVFRSASSQAAESAPKAAEAGLIDVIIQVKDGSGLKVAHQPAPPPYPAEARKAGLQGTVVTKLKVAPDGSAAVASVEGPEALQATARAYAPGWRFRASQAGGMATLTLDFRLVSAATAR